MQIDQDKFDKSFGQFSLSVNQILKPFEKCYGQDAYVEQSRKQLQILIEILKSNLTRKEYTPYPRFVMHNGFKYNSNKDEDYTPY